MTHKSHSKKPKYLPTDVSRTAHDVLLISVGIGDLTELPTHLCVTQEKGVELRVHLGADSTQALRVPLMLPHEVPFGLIDELMLLNERQLDFDAWFDSLEPFAQQNPSWAQTLLGVGQFVARVFPHVATKFKAAQELADMLVLDAQEPDAPRA